MSAIRHTLKAYERLKREQHIDTLFRTGKAYSFFPVRILFLLTTRSATEPAPVRTGFSVPKKKFRKAVHRNRIKRQMREIWRLNKQQIYPKISGEEQLHIFFIFTGTELPEFATVEAAMKKAIEKLSKHLH